MTREEFIIIYEKFEFEYSNALKKADLEYQSVVSSVSAYQKIVNPAGKQVGKEPSDSKKSANFVLDNTILPSGNTQEKELYLYKVGDLTLTIPSGIEGYPDFGPFSIDPVDHVGDEKNPADTKLSSEKLSAIYGKIVSGYTSPILFKYLEVDFLLHEVDYLKGEVKNLRKDVNILKAELAALTAGISAVPNAVENTVDKIKGLFS